MIAALGLAACSENGTATTSTDSKKTATEQKEKKEEASAKLEATDTTGSAWIPYDGSEYVYIHGGAIYTNTGNTAVSIGETQINRKAIDGSILGTETMVYSVPRVVLPGETAFISTTSYVEGVSIDDYAESTYNFSFDATDEDPNLMEVSGVKGILGEENYRVTGIVKNISDVQQDDIRIAAALFNGEGKLIGVLTSSIDIGVAPGSEAGFDLSYPELSPEVLKTIQKIEVKAYGWTW